MMEKLPVKHKWLFIAAALLLMWICYVFAFKKTIAAWQLNRELKARVAAAQDLSLQPAYLERKDANLKKLLNLYRADTLSFRNEKVNLIAAAAESVNARLSEVPNDEPAYHGNKWVIQRLDFQGSYFALTRLLDKVEHLPSVGVIRCAEYQLNRNPTAQDKTQLSIRIYFEFIK